jgi:very-short-patch-repair endonuclease
MYWIFTVQPRGWQSRLMGAATAFLQGKNTIPREAFLAESGIAVLRFYNQAVYEEFDGVLQAIWFALERRGINAIGGWG